MATYTIIGGDGKEYGPITADDLRKWIAEGRLNAQSLAKAESDAEFRTLEKFPEFADAFAPNAHAAGRAAIACKLHWTVVDAITNWTSAAASAAAGNSSKRISGRSWASTS